MVNASSRFEAVIAAVDRYNAGDPRQESAGTGSEPREVVYARRMTLHLSQLYPDASETLQIAARAQHIGRWEVPRHSYPPGREGYHAWRLACRNHHAAIIAPIMRDNGYEQPQIDLAAKIIRKQELKRNRESQALENVVGVVFAAYYLQDFIAAHKDYGEEKLVEIVRKTLRKMDADGHAAILAMQLPPAVEHIVGCA